MSSGIGKISEENKKIREDMEKNIKDMMTKMQPILDQYWHDQKTKEELDEIYKLPTTRFIYDTLKQRSFFLDFAYFFFKKTKIFSKKNKKD